MSFKQEMDTVRNMIKEMDDYLSILTEQVDFSINDIYGFDLRIKDYLSTKTKEDIENITEESQLYIDVISPDNNYVDADNLKEMQSSDSKFKDEPFIKYLTEILLDIKKSLDELEDMKKKKDELVAESESMTDKYIDYLRSDEYKETRKKMIENLKKSLETEEDTHKKGKMVKMIQAMEDRDTLNFLFARINKYGDKEVNTIKNIFFDNNLSRLVMEKFNNKFPKYGYDENVYKMFFNIEEKFLPEEYHDLNNIFLFHVMRFISFTDINDKVSKFHISAILTKLCNLLYHKFSTQEEEDDFVNIIKSFDDRFMEYKDEFTEKNITSPKHPRRIEKDKEYDEKLRALTIASLQNEGIEPDTNLSTEELKNMLRDVIDKKAKEAEEEATEEVVEESETVEDTTDEETESDEEDTAVLKFDNNSQLSDAIESISSEPLVVEFDDFVQSIGESIREEEIVPEMELTNEDIERISEAADNLKDMVIEETEPVNDVENIEEQAEVSSDSNEDDSMVVPREKEDDVSVAEIHIPEKTDAEETPEDVVEQIEVYKDRYDCYYVEDNGVYCYCDQDGNEIEENIPEDEILRLISTGSLTKVKMTV